MGQILIRSIVRPERAQNVIDALLEAGYPAVTKVSVAGRGRQRGLRVGDITYDELPKELLMTVVPETEKALVLRTVMESARTGEAGNYGDGKIFVTPVEEVYTISSGFREE